MTFATLVLVYMVDRAYRRWEMCELVDTRFESVGPCLFAAPCREARTFGESLSGDPWRPG